MKTITASKLRVEFASIIKDLDSGPVHVTKHGKTIAILSSPDAAVETPTEPASMTATPKAPERSQTPLEAYETPDEEYEFEAGEWSDGLDAEFEAYLSRVREPIDRPFMS